MADADNRQRTRCLRLDYGDRTLAAIYRSVDFDGVEADQCLESDCEVATRLLVVSIPQLQAVPLCEAHAWEFIEDNAPVASPTVGEMYRAARGLIAHGFSDRSVFLLGSHAVEPVGSLAGRFAVRERGGHEITVARLADFRGVHDLANYLTKAVTTDLRWVDRADQPIDSSPAVEKDDEEDTSSWGFR